MAASIEGGSIESGTYTPTYTIISNIVSVSAATVCQYLKVGNVVTVSGMVTFLPDAAATAGGLALDVTLPVASTFTNNYQCNGTSGSGTAAGVASQIYGIEGVATKARIAGTPVAIVNRNMHFTFTYLII